MAPMLSVQATCCGTILLGSVFIFASLTIALASSLPPENHHMNLHLGPVEHKSSFSPDPIEDMHNSLLSGGREVEPRPPAAAIAGVIIPAGAMPPANVSSSPSSVKKELGTEVPSLTGSKEVGLSRDQPKQALDHEDLSAPVTVAGNVEVKPFNDFAAVDRESVASSIVPRKGVGDMPPSVVARKGAEMNSSYGVLESDLVMTTSNLADVMIPDTSTSPTTSTSYQTSTASGFIAAVPVNDIPMPPVKQVTTERSSTLAPPSPSPSQAYSPSSLSYAPPPPAASPPTKHASKHLKPAVAVDAVNNKALDNTPVIIGVTFGVLIIIVLAIVAYKRLQDVWSRRHYDRMDFLIDGMYDL